MNVTRAGEQSKRIERALERPQVQMKRTAASKHRVPKWAYLLFIILAAFFVTGSFKRTASEVKPAQPTARPALVLSGDKRCACVSRRNRHLRSVRNRAGAGTGDRQIIVAIFRTART